MASQPSTCCSAKPDAWQVLSIVTSAWTAQSPASCGHSRAGLLCTGACVSEHCQQRELQLPLYSQLTPGVWGAVQQQMRDA